MGIIVYCSFQTHPSGSIYEEPQEPKVEYIIPATNTIKEEINSDPEGIEGVMEVLGTEIDMSGSSFVDAHVSQLQSRP